MKRALTRWAPRELLWSGNAYVEARGLPSAHHERYLGACWDESSASMAQWPTSAPGLSGSFGRWSAR